MGEMAFMVSCSAVAGRSRGGNAATVVTPAKRVETTTTVRSSTAAVKKQKRARGGARAPVKEVAAVAAVAAMEKAQASGDDLDAVFDEQAIGLGRSFDCSLTAYLKEIGSVSMLETDEVVKCSLCVQKLLRWEEKRNEFLEAREREPSLQEWADALEMPHAPFVAELVRLRSAKDKLVAANLRLVVSIAKRYMSSGKLSMLDLIQEGSLGLIRGAERFDASKGFRFATYVSWWIRQAIQRAASESSRQIRLPPHLNTTARKVYRLRKELSLKNLKEPTFEELAEELDMTVPRLRFVLEKDKATDTLSLDKPVRGSMGEDILLTDFIADERLSPEQSLTQNLLRDDLENVLSMLTDTEKQVIRMRYGFDDGVMKNHEEIASIYSVPSVKIRQIEARALRKLRHPNMNRCLKEYVQS